MNTLLRRFFILAAVLLCCTAMANAANPDAVKIDGIYYNFDKANGTATVTSGGSKYKGDITIPAKVTYESKEYIVTSIGASAFYKNNALTSITIPSGVTSIGASAFYMCRNLESITIPSAVTSIGDNAFAECDNLASVTFEEGSKLESIGAGAFANSYALASITIPSAVTSIGDNAFAECSNLASVTFAEGSKLESIGAGAFANSDALASITIPNRVTSIGDNSFAECDKLASVTFEEGSKLESIGAGAFARNNALTSITIPSSVTSIGASAFYWCLNLASITIPSGVTSIGDNAFAECNKLASVTFEEGSKLESIGAGAFANSYALTSITIPSSVTNIGASAFYWCLNLASISIPSGVTSIGDKAFADCNKLASVTFEEGSKLESIGAGAFANSYALESITIPSGVTSIGAGAFANSNALASITIPSGVTSIGDKAFADCGNLAEITVNWIFPKDIPEISSSVFTGVEKSKCILYAPLLGVYDKKEEWKDFTIHAENNNIAVKKNDGTIKLQLANNDNVIEVNEKDMTLFAASQDVSNVKSITYTRDFTNVAGKWQTWFVPFEAPVSVLNDAELDVAEIGGILFDKDKNAVVAFNMMDGGTMNANTPYVVRLKADATEKVPTLTFKNANLKATEEDSFSIQSAYDKFTFTGNYKSKHVDDSYTLNKDGEFQQMGAAVSLKPMRFSLSITPRDDSPYGNDPAGQAPKSAIRYMVLGDDGTLQPIDEDGRTGIKPATTPANSFRRSQQPMRIYDLHGRKVNRIQSKQVYIIDGKTYTAR